MLEQAYWPCHRGLELIWLITIITILSPFLGKKWWTYITIFNYSMSKSSMCLCTRSLSSTYWLLTPWIYWIEAKYPQHLVILAFNGLCALVTRRCQGLRCQDNLLAFRPWRVLYCIGAVSTVWIGYRKWANAARCCKTFSPRCLAAR